MNPKQKAHYKKKYKGQVKKIPSMEVIHTFVMNFVY